MTTATTNSQTADTTKTDPKKRSRIAGKLLLAVVVAIAALASLTGAAGAATSTGDWKTLTGGCTYQGSARPTSAGLVESRITSAAGADARCRQVDLQFVIVDSTTHASITSPRYNMGNFASVGWNGGVGGPYCVYQHVYQTSVRVYARGTNTLLGYVTSGSPKALC